MSNDSNELIALETTNLPAHLVGRTSNENAFANAMSAGGFPVVSIKGKVFHIHRGTEVALVHNGTVGKPALSLEVVILQTNPSRSKIYYEKSYVEGSVDKPDCYSNGGEVPAPDATSPQAKKCAVCPHNQWGSRITDSGGKGKACSDAMRLAIAAPSQINDPMLIRVPAMSLKGLGLYGEQLAKRNVEPHHVVTEIGFKYELAHPELTFKAVRFVEPHELAQIDAALVSEKETLGQIIGNDDSVMTEAESAAEVAPVAAPAVAPAPVAPAVAPAPAAPAVAPAPVAPAVAPAPVAPAVAPAPVAPAVAPAPVAPAVAPAPVAPAVAPAAEAAKVADFDSIDEALENLDFDD